MVLKNFNSPPILTIEVDQSKQINVTGRVQRKTAEQIAIEFALAAREAVDEQMQDLQDDTMCDDLGEIAKSAQSTPPESMKPTSMLESFGTAKIQEIVMDGSKDPSLGEKIEARDLVGKHSGSDGCIVFVIRRPGCLLCREQALYLKFLFENHSEQVQGFTIVGIVKEFCDKKGGEKLQEFHDTYFPFPLYLDIDKAAYRALGNRRASLGSALKVLNPFSETAKRIKKNQIRGNMSGEGFLQGGVIIYHKNGMAAYKYEEETGLELPVANIVRAMRSVRRDDFSPILPTTDASPDGFSIRAVE